MRHKLDRNVASVERRRVWPGRYAILSPVARSDLSALALFVDGFIHSLFPFLRIIYSLIGNFLIAFILTPIKKTFSERFWFVTDAK